MHRCPRARLASLALLLVGCATPQVEPVYPIEPARCLAVLPYAKSHAPFAEGAPRPDVLARATIARLTELATFRVCPYDRVEEQARRVDPERGDLGGLATRLGADLLLACDLELLAPSSGCLMQTRARVRVRLFDGVEGRWVRQDQVDLVVPSDVVSEGWFPETEAELEEGLVRAIARKVALLYLRHDVQRVEVE